MTSQENPSTNLRDVNLNAHDAIIAHFLDARSWRAGRPMVLGLCGSQGSGKSTVTCALQSTLREAHGVSVAVLSLDDLYLAGAERERLARDVHPLLRTRGVPGTHDVGLGIEVIGQLLSAAPDAITRIPRFDKALDEPCPPGRWEAFRGRADLVILEGWCVGALPQEGAALEEPVNGLERDEDGEGRWRKYVNGALAGRYQALFGLIDGLVLLRAPGFEVVFEWRRQQERELAANSRAGATGIMDDAALRRFIMTYERLTRHILVEMPQRAHLVVGLDEHRHVVSVEGRGGLRGCGSV